MSAQAPSLRRAAGRAPDYSGARTSLTPHAPPGRAEPSRPHPQARCRPGPNHLSRDRPSPAGCCAVRYRTLGPAPFSPAASGLTASGLRHPVPRHPVPRHLVLRRSAPRHPVRAVRSPAVQPRVIRHRGIRHRGTAPRHAALGYPALGYPAARPPTWNCRWLRHHRASYAGGRPGLAPGWPVPARAAPCRADAAALGIRPRQDSSGVSPRTAASRAAPDRPARRVAQARQQRGDLHGGRRPRDCRSSLNEVMRASHERPPVIGTQPAARRNGQPVEVVADELLGRGAHALIIPLRAALVEPARARFAQAATAGTDRATCEGRRPRRSGTASCCALPHTAPRTSRRTARSLAGEPD